MKTVLAIVALTLPFNLSARADVIRCFQTEPFITEVFNTETGEAKITDSVMEKTIYLQGVKMVLVGGGKIEFRTAEGKVIRTIDLTQKGSDGMSDNEYPFACTDVNGHWGGGGDSSELKTKGNF